MDFRFKDFFFNIQDRFEIVIITLNDILLARDYNNCNHGFCCPELVQKNLYKYQFNNVFVLFFICRLNHIRLYSSVLMIRF